MIPDEAANMEEILQQAAQAKFGRPFSELTEDEKAAIYQDYEGLRDVQNADYLQGQELMDKDITQGIQAGDVYVGSGAGNALAEIAMKYAGKKKQDAATAELGKLSEQYSKGSRAAGEVAANTSGEDRRLLMSILNNRQKSNTATNTPAAPAPPVPTPETPPPPPPPAQAAAPQSQVAPQGPMGGQDPRQAVNAAMAMQMQGTPQQVPQGMGQQSMPPVQSQAGPTVMKAQADRLRKLEEEEKLRAMGIMR